VTAEHQRVVRVLVWSLDALIVWFFSRLVIISLGNQIQLLLSVRQTHPEAPGTVIYLLEVPGYFLDFGTGPVDSRTIRVVLTVYCLPNA
jgi:hypothetical protein